jgi:pantoate--beta-alanine ligase
MGALHKGHLSLIRQARKENDAVIISIFVNPAQFGPKDDFKKYPRSLKQDVVLCKKEGADIVFLPGVNSMYPENYKTYICVEDLSDYLCGKFRPGHFKGVATVVTKLFNIVNPDTAYFGQKDAQQSIIINKMVQDLNMPVKIKVMPTIREADGLAMSSRNVYLSQNERKDAAVLYQALIAARKLIRQGKLDSSKIIHKLRQLINTKKSAKIQYIAVVDPSTLRALSRIKGKTLVALAVWIGKARLIDNVIVSSNIKTQKSKLQLKTQKL